jgi:hypothetical protein
MFNVGRIAGDQIVHRNDGMPFGQKAIAEMGAKKTCPTGNQNTHNGPPSG